MKCGMNIRKLLVLLLLASMIHMIELYGQQTRLIDKSIPAPSLGACTYGNSTTQTIGVYLPPSYASSEYGYPVLYFLTGFGDRIGDWEYGPYCSLQATMDRLISSGTVKEMIVVVVSGTTFLGGSFYTNSDVSGYWEDFVVKDVVTAVDKSYRTLPSAESRAIAGHSMGGFGAFSIGMHSPNVFGAVFGLSPGLFGVGGMQQSSLFPTTQFIDQFVQKEQEWNAMSASDALQSFKTYAQSRWGAGDWQTTFAYGYGAAFSPNPGKKAPSINYPYFKVNGVLSIDSTYLRNFENGFGGWPDKLDKYGDNLRKLKSITLEYGTQDEYVWIPSGCEYVSSLLRAKGITHRVSSFVGGHQDRTQEQFEKSLLPTVSVALADGKLTAVATATTGRPRKNDVFKVIPGRSRPEMTLSVEVSAGSYGQIKIYDVLGREIEGLFEGSFHAGANYIQWRTAGLSKGMYIARLVTENGTEARRIILLGN